MQDDRATRPSRLGAHTVPRSILVNKVNCSACAFALRKRLFGLGYEREQVRLVATDDVQCQRLALAARGGALLAVVFLIALDNDPVAAVPHQAGS